jgi:hypothetical protein
LSPPCWVIFLCSKKEHINGLGVKFEADCKEFEADCKQFEADCKQFEADCKNSKLKAKKGRKNQPAQVAEDKRYA